MRKPGKISMFLCVAALAAASFSAMAFRGQVTYYDADGMVVGIVRSGCGATDTRWGIVTERYEYQPCNVP